MDDEMDPAPWVKLCGAIAPIASFLVGFSPLPTIRRVQIERKVGNLPLLPYTAIIINATLWLGYGLLTKEIRIWSCNGAGVILGVYYFINFIKYCPPSSSTLPGTVQQHIQAIIAGLLFTVFTIIASTNAAAILGKAGMTVCVALFASPLTALRVVIETGSARSIPLPFTLACIVNCFLWSVWGLWETNDPNVYIPNVLGLLLSLTQLGVKFYYEDNIFKEFHRDALADDMLASTKKTLSPQPSDADNNNNINTTQTGV